MVDEIIPYIWLNLSWRGLRKHRKDEDFSTILVARFDDAMKDRGCSCARITDLTILEFTVTCVMFLGLRARDRSETVDVCVCVRQDSYA